MPAPDNMLVRRLGSADAAAFQALRLAALRDSASAFSSTYEAERETPLSTIESNLAQRILFGAFAGAELAGMIGIGRESSPKLRHKACLRAVYVAPAHRGRGAARQLIEHALAFAASMDGVLQLTLDVTAGNGPALHLYESVGFRQYGCEPRGMLVDGVFHDVILMARPSAPG